MTHRRAGRTHGDRREVETATAGIYKTWECFGDEACNQGTGNARLIGEENRKQVFILNKLHSHNCRDVLYWSIQWTETLLEHNAIKCLSQIKWCVGGKLSSAVITGKILIPSYSTREQYWTVLELSQRLKLLWWLELNYWLLESSCSFQGTNST